MENDEALGAMLISWYMSGYHTGYYLVGALALTAPYVATDGISIF